MNQQANNSLKIKRTLAMKMALNSISHSSNHDTRDIFLTRHYYAKENR